MTPVYGAESGIAMLGPLPGPGRTAGPVKILHHDPEQEDR
jgi:hypothetical protein